jgi:hypothetical protein
MAKYCSKCSFQSLLLAVFLLLLQTQISYSAATNNQPEIIRAIANYKIFKFDKNFYATVNNKLEIERDNVLLTQDIITGDKLSFVEQQIINRIDKKPLFHATVASYNIVIYAGNVYGVPQGLTINWEDTNHVSVPGLILGKSIVEVQNQILENPRSWQPILLDELFKFNVVNFKDSFYGVPHGYNVDFYKDNLSSDSRLITAGSSLSVKMEIIRKTFSIWINQLIQ